MKSRIPLLIVWIMAAAFVLAACGGAMAPAATQAPATQAPAAMEAYAEAPVNGQRAPDSSAAGAPAALPTAAFVDTGVQPADTNAAAGAGHMIIKNADVKLLVADTDVAVDLTTQIAGDLGGYIISSRVWFQPYYDYNLKYATLTLGVPVEQFEHALTRLRALSIRVLDETASGEDVTNQYVDLQSQLTNLESTRERIKSFLDQAKTVDEALRINQQLSDVERQIEQIKGQINYLSDRSAYSTITINFEPQQPEIASTPTPTPTPAPAIWNPGKTFENSKKTVITAYQGITDFLIWFFVVLVPILAPLLLILWGLWKLLRRKPSQPPSAKE